MGGVGVRVGGGVEGEEMREQDEVRHTCTCAYTYPYPYR